MRTDDFDFDMIVDLFPQSLSPGNEQRGYWTSAAAASPAASNYAGVSDPVIDELVELLINAPDRESLVARARVLDRLLLFGHYVIPQWHLRMQRVLYWDKFSRPSVTPRSGTSVDYWWFDEAKAARLESARKSQPEAGRDEATGGPGIVKPLVAVLMLGVVVFMVLRYRQRGRKRT